MCSTRTVPPPGAATGAALATSRRSGLRSGAISSPAGRSPSSAAPSSPATPGCRGRIPSMPGGRMLKPRISCAARFTSWTFPWAFTTTCLHHPGKDGVDRRRRGRCRPRSEVADDAIERPGDGSELVGTIVANRPRQVARGVPLGGLGQNIQVDGRAGRRSRRRPPARRRARTRARTGSPAG